MMAWRNISIALATFIIAILLLHGFALGVDQPKSQAASSEQTADDLITVMAVGDVMLGSGFPDGSRLPPKDGAELLQEVTPILQRGDITFGNLEGPLVDEGVSQKCRGKFANCFAFRVPTRYSRYLKSAGFTVMGLANNHALDFGAAGRASSREVLDAMGIAHSGEIGDVARFTIKGTKIALIAFATYPGSYNLLNLDDAIATVKQLKSESDMVIVSFHGGAEGASHQHVVYGDEPFLSENRGNVRQFAHTMINSGAQLVIGSGPHVVRGMEVYCGRLIAYSLGNFATYGSFNLSGPNGLSLVLEVRLAKDGSFLDGKIYPVMQVKPGGPQLDANNGILPVLRDLSADDFPSTHVDVSPEGELAASSTSSASCVSERNYSDRTLQPARCGAFYYHPCSESLNSNFRFVY